MSFLAQVQDYAASVMDGILPSCQMVKLAVERWQRDWERDDLYFDEKTFNLFCRFARALKHFKGEFAGRPIILEPWQMFIAANLFGWKFKKTRRRRYTYADVYVPRKNGKTTFAAIVGLFMLLLDGEASAEVYAAAVDMAQAKICFEAASELIRGTEFMEIARIFRKGSIVVEETASAFKPLSKDTKNKDGLNIHCGICDERHAWKTNEIYEVLKTGIGARSQPLIFSISTAGTDTSYPYFRDLEFLRQVMLGIKEKDNHFIMLYEPDDGDPWDDPATWAKVNPNYGVSLSRTYMENECQEARDKGGSTLAAFLTKNLNKWVDAPEVWIPDDDVAANNAEFDETQLQGAECFVGLDLASKADLSAVCLFFPRYMVAKLIFVVPEEKIREKGDRVDYRLWQQQGFITATPGKVLDEDWFVTFLLQQLAPFSVRCIAYDPWSIWNILPKLSRYEEVLLEYQQSIRYMSVPTKWVQAEVLKHRLNFLGNPVLRWMFRNVVIYIDPNANVKLDKARARNKIDGVVALADAVGGWLNKTSGKTGQIYTTHGLRVIHNESRDDEATE